MVRVITQETYDEVVRENIEEFDMTPQEAITEAVAQFEAQGVDLSNIIKDLALSCNDDHLVSMTVAKLKNLDKEADQEQIIQELKIVKAECNKGIAYRVRAAKNGAYKVVTTLLESRYKAYQTNKHDTDAQFVTLCLDTLAALMDVQPDLLEAKGLDLIKSILDNVKEEAILIETLKWCCVCCKKHEMNRQALFQRNIVTNIKGLVKGTKNRKLLSETLHLIRKLTLDDDIRVEFGKAHEHAREMGTHLLESLAALLKGNTKPPLVSELMLTIAALLVRNELCAAVADSADILMAVMTENYDNVNVIQQGYRLLEAYSRNLNFENPADECPETQMDLPDEQFFRVVNSNTNTYFSRITALAGNDDVKRKLINCGMAPVTVSLLNRHMSNTGATALCLKCIAALTLRSPRHGEQFIEAGAADALITAMKVHPSDGQVQKNACWAIRNIVARSKDQNPKFHELGVEGLLNQAYDKFYEDFGYDIRSALRDLDCDVKLQEQWTGKGVEIEQ